MRRAGRWIPTDVRPFFRHDAGCKSVFYLGYVGESCAQWFLVALCAERFVALSWPLWSRRALAYNRSLHICQFIAAACALVCVPAAVCFKEKNFGCGNYPPKGTIYASLMAYVTIAQKYAYSTLAMLALSVAIAVKLLLIARDFRRASVPQMASVGAERPATSSSLRVSAGEKARRRGNVSAALTSVVLALLQSSLYLSRAVLWGLDAIGVSTFKLFPGHHRRRTPSWTRSASSCTRGTSTCTCCASESCETTCAAASAPAGVVCEGPQSLPRTQQAARHASQSGINSRNGSAFRSKRNSRSSFSGSPAAARLLVSSGALTNSSSSKSDQQNELKLGTTHVASTSIRVLKRLESNVVIETIRIKNFTTNANSLNYGLELEYETRKPQISVLHVYRYKITKTLSRNMKQRHENN